MRRSRWPTSATRCLAALIRPRTGVSLNRLVAVFAMSSIVNSALASNIVAALIERRLTPSRAAFIGGMFGVMQVPGRLLMTNKAFTPRPFPLLLVSFALQVVGLVALMADTLQAAMWIGVIVFATGAGLTTLARPISCCTSTAPSRRGASTA